MLRDHVLRIVSDYIEAHPRECGLSRLVQHVRARDEFWSRRDLKGHITCSALLINPKLQVLQVYHRALDRWLFPGGHIEDEDQSLPDAALREVEEEVSISREYLLTAFEREAPIDINYHIIPANQVNAQPRHFHWDFRYVFFASRATLRCNQDEIKAAAWRDIRELHTPIIAKLNTLLSEATTRRASPW